MITPCDYLGHEDLFLYSSSVYSCHIFLISSASVRSIPFLSFIESIPCPRAKEKPQKDGGGSKIGFRIKPHTHQRCSEGSSKPCVHQDPETPQRLRQNHIWVSPDEVQVSSGLQQRQGLWVQQTWVWHKSAWRLPLTHHRAARTYTGVGKLTLGGHKQNLVHTRTLSRGAVTPQETDPDLPVHVQESLAEVWVGNGLLQGGGTEYSRVCMGHVEGGCHYLYYLHHSLASVQTTGREHSPALQQRIGLKIYWALLQLSEQDPVSPSVSLFHQEASISLLSFSTRGQTE